MIATLVCIAALSSAQSPQARSGWTSFALPGVCNDVASTPYVARLLRGQHLVMQGDLLEREAPTRASVLPVRSLLDWLQDDLHKNAHELRIQPGAPPIVVRGDPADVAALDQRLKDLDLASASLDIELRAWLVPSGGATSTHPTRAEFEHAVAAQPAWGEIRARSGQTVVFGQRAEQSYLGGWMSVVATSSGVAEPRLVRAMLGQTLHLSAARMPNGARVRLAGLLDLSEPGATQVIDPETPDLGEIQLPSVHALQVAFSGSVESGGLLAISIEGAPLAQPAWTLWIEARTKPDVANGGLRVCDLAWLETPCFALPMVQPGAGLESVTGDESPLGGGFEPLTSASIAQTLEEVRSRAGASSRSPILWSPGLLVISRDDADSLRELDGLLDAAARVRNVESDVLVTRGTFSVRLPITAASNARVLSVNERTLVTNYSVEIASETWMPNPRIDRVLDGTCVQGQLVGGRFVASGWSASGEVTSQLSRKEARLGQMQLVKRTLRGERVTLDREHAKAAFVPADGATAALAIELVSR